ncbi:hypothetical protein E4U55_000411, partial [Claviceps digitariae]
MATGNFAQVLNGANTCPSAPECGYESPHDQTQPAFFSSPSATPSVQPATLSPLSTTPVLTKPPTSAPLLGPRVSFSPQVPASNQSNIQNVMTKADKVRPAEKVTLKDRIACYQWTYFAMTMATGGVANVLHA